MEERTRKIAEEFAIIHRMEALESDLLKIPGVAFNESADGIDFDIRHWYDRMYYVVLIPKYDIPVSDPNYYAHRREMLNKILETCKLHGLTRSEDRIEDYGGYFYIVTKCAPYWYDGIEEARKG